MPTRMKRLIVNVKDGEGNFVPHDLLYDDSKEQIQEKKNQALAQIETLMNTDTTLTVSGAAADAKVTGDNLNMIQNSAEDVLEQITGNRGLIWKIGRYYTSAGTSAVGMDVTYDSANQNFACCISPCVKGDVFYAYLRGYSGNNRAYYICDSSMKALKVADPNITVQGIVQITQDNAAYIVFTNRLSTIPSGYYAYKGKSIKDKESDFEKTTNAINGMVFGSIDFPFVYESGTYHYTTTGSVLEKYYASPYNTTRKVLSSVCFDAPCTISMIAKPGYVFRVFNATEDNKIISDTGTINSYTFSNGSRYGIVLQAKNGTDDISAVTVDDIIYIINRENEATLEPICPFVEDSYINPSTGGTTSASYYSATDYVYCKGFDYFEYTNYYSSNATAQTQMGMAFYNENNVFLSGETFGSVSSGNSVRMNLIRIPENAYYARFTYPRQAQIEDYGIQDFYAVLIKSGSIYTRIGKNDGVDNPLPDLYPYKPRSEGVANVIRTAHKMTGVKWTPVEDFPRMYMTYTSDYGTSKFLKGVEYTGIPYSHSQDRQNIIGIEVSLDRFMSAVANSGSVLYANLLNRPYFGAVCSSFVVGVLGLKGSETTYSVHAIDGMELIAPKGAYDEYTFELGDICIYASLHVLMITGILTDQNGVIKLIEVSEAALYGVNAGGKAISKWWEPSKFFANKIGNRDYKLYRYKYIDSVPYYSSDFSQVYPEPLTHKKINQYCCPYYGDGASTTTDNTGYPITISSDAYTDGFTKLVVYRNGVFVNEIDIASDTTSVSVDRTVSGRYMAYLTNGNGDKSMPCSWDVYSVSVSASVSGTSMTVTYDTDGMIYSINYSYGGNPYSVECELTGSGTKVITVPSGASPIDVTVGNRSSCIHVAF